MASNHATIQAQGELIQHSGDDSWIQNTMILVDGAEGSNPDAIKRLLENQLCSPNTDDLQMYILYVQNTWDYLGSHMRTSVSIMVVQEHFKHGYFWC